MKAEDLMRGFIVNTPKGIGKVLQAFDNGAAVQIGEDWNNFFYEELSFVRITKEGLEKNGFKWLSTEPSGNITYICNEPSIIIIKMKDYWFVNIGPAGSEKMPFVEVNWIIYFHQLQLALKLGGIDKEITF